jgi:hypothetical protein
MSLSKYGDLKYFEIFLEEDSLRQISKQLESSPMSLTDELSD